MTSAAAQSRTVRWGALTIGVVLFFATLYYVNFRVAFGTIQRLGIALPLALFFSGLWHLARTWAWAWCFQQPKQISFARLFRVRLSAEAFSYLTLRGIAGEPLKVVLLSDRIDARQATAAVALERLAYLVGTTVIVGLGSLLAIASLPLTHLWFRIFRAFAIAAGVLAALAALVISGRGSYLHALIWRIDRGMGTSMTEGRVWCFVTSVERQMLELVRGNPRRLAVLMLATLASYICMALEAWVILRASGAPITLNGALAVETFSRVASFASSFIPANLGALEASSIAAVAAVGVTGGAALALARRLRGLFWAGLGLAIYPRRRQIIGPSGVTRDDDRHVERRHTLLYFPYGEGVDVLPSALLAGLPIAERVLRSALRAGYTRMVVWAPELRGVPAESKRLMRALAHDMAGSVTVATTGHEWAEAIATVPPTQPVTAIGPGTVVSPALLSTARSIVPAPGEISDVAAGDNWPESGVLRLMAVDAANHERVAAELRLRREEALPLPDGDDVTFGRARLALRITSSSDLESAERTIRRSSYKDTDATVARFNRRMSLPISIVLMRLPVTANQISVLLVVIGFYSAWLFSLGHYWTGVLAAFLSLAASVLDGCDGEIARLKYQESALGCWIETIGDYAYYIAIFIGLTVGAVHETRLEFFYWIGGIALAGLLLTFALLIFLRTRITSGQPDKLRAIAGDRFVANPTLVSRVLWRVSFVANRAAMPYGIMAFALLDLLPGVVVLAALGGNIYWISLVVKLRNLLGAEEDWRSAEL